MTSTNTPHDHGQPLSRLRGLRGLTDRPQRETPHPKPQVNAHIAGFAGLRENLHPSHMRASATDDFEGIAVGEPARVITPELFKVSVAMKILSMSRTVIYEQMRSGRLRYVKQGRATLITREAIREYVALLEQEAGVRYDETA